MRKKFTLALLMGIGCATAFAQQQHGGKMPLKEKMRTFRALNTTEASNQKTTAIIQRLKGHASYYDMGTGLQLSDSMIYMYSSGRGSAFDFDWLEYNDYYYYPEFMLGSSYVNYDSMARTMANSTSAKKYTTSGKTLSQSFYTSPGGSRSTWSYDANGRIVSSLDETYNSITSAWEPNYRTFFTYDGSGKLISDSSESYFMSTWDPQSKSEYTYTGNQLTMGTMYDWNGSGWDPEERYSFTYTGTMITGSIGEEHNGTTWENDEKIDITYAGNKKTSEIYYDWNGTAWILDSEEFRHLNSNNLPDSVFYRYYMGGPVPTWDTTITKLAYNTFDNPTVVSYYDANMVIDNEDHYYYQDYDPQSVKEVAAVKQVMVYPNPAKDQLNVVSKEMNAGTARYTIVNTIGQAVTKGSLNITGNGLSVDVSSLSPGMYYINVQDAKGVAYNAAFSK